MKNFLDYVIRALIAYPDEFILQEIDGGRTVFYRVEMHRDDVGKVIGKGGHTIAAIRNILSAVAERDGRKVQLEMIGTQP